MLGIIYHWSHKDGLGPDGHRVLYQHFNYTVRAFCPDLVVMVDEYDTFTQGIDELTVIKPSFIDALLLFDGYEPVYLHGGADETLASFTHPANSVYVIGPDYGGLIVPSNALSARVEYPGVEMEIWASVALGIVL